MERMLGLLIDARAEALTPARVRSYNRLVAYYQKLGFKSWEPMLAPLVWVLP